MTIKRTRPRSISIFSAREKNSKLKGRTQEEVDQQVKAFKDSGGEVQNIPRGVSARFNERVVS